MISDFTGVAISAAAVGVGARLSATKSRMVVSVSCPIDEMIGMSLAKAALATSSSLNDIKSSSEPPPRATMSKSGRGMPLSPVILLKPEIASHSCSAEPLPCTKTGQTRT